MYLVRNSLLRWNKTKHNSVLENFSGNEHNLWLDQNLGDTCSKSWAKEWDRPGGDATTRVVCWLCWFLDKYHLCKGTDHTLARRKPRGTDRNHHVVVGCHVYKLEWCFLKKRENFEWGKERGGEQHG